MSLRSLPTAAALLLLAAALPADAGHVCGVPEQTAHAYGPWFNPAVTTTFGTTGVYEATVHDADFCDYDTDGVPDFTGDHETGAGGAFFGTDQNLACGGFLLHHYPAWGTVAYADTFFTSVRGVAGYEADATNSCLLDGLVSTVQGDCLREFVNSHPADPCSDGWADDAQTVLLAGPNADGGVWGFLGNPHFDLVNNVIYAASTGVAVISPGGGVPGAGPEKAVTESKDAVL